jgi:hypothetical protein
MLVNTWAFFIVPAAPNVPLSFASAHVLLNMLANAGRITLQGAL